MMKKVILISLFFLLFPWCVVSAIEPVAITPFTVQDINNTPVQSDQLAKEPKWVLLYLERGCRHCDDILHTLEAFKDPLISKRIVVVVGGGGPEDIREFIASSEKIASFGWYADPDWSAFKALPISGSPVIFGIRHGVIEWSIAGSPWDAKAMQSVLLNW